MTLTPSINTKEHVQGAPDAPIVLVKYGDYQCPYCADLYHTIKKLQKKFGNKFAFVFRHFPLDMHPYALSAAIAAEIMAKNNQFWSMHEMLYENQDRLADHYLFGYAEQLGVNRARFKKDFADEQFMDKIQSDIDGGVKSGVNGTPSIFINGKKYEGDDAFESLASYFRGLLSQPTNTNKTR